MFKPGDFVKCIKPVQFLPYDTIMTVEMGGDDSILIRLVGYPGWYRADHFKLADKLTNTFSAGNEIFKGIDYTITDSASKNDSDKIDLSLIPQVALKEEAKAFMVGERKYNRYNYCKGHKASQLIAAALRHLTAWNEGEENDPIDGQHHLGSARACCAMILRQMELGTLKDDRFKK